MTQRQFRALRAPAPPGSRAGEQKRPRTRGGHINPAINQADFPGDRDVPACWFDSGWRDSTACSRAARAGTPVCWLAPRAPHRLAARSSYRCCVNMVVVKLPTGPTRATSPPHAEYPCQVARQDYDLRIETIQYPCPQDRKTGSLRRIDSVCSGETASISRGQWRLHCDLPAAPFDCGE